MSQSGRGLYGGFNLQAIKEELENEPKKRKDRTMSKPYRDHQQAMADIQGKTRVQEISTRGLYPLFILIILAITASMLLVVKNWNWSVYAQEPKEQEAQHKSLPAAKTTDEGWEKQDSTVKKQGLEYSIEKTRTWTNY